jgi:deoxyribonucleoside regulator
MTDLRKLVKVANYYYRDGLTQQEIAAKMSTSRQHVNRLLKRSVEEGIVKIEIVNYLSDNITLERELERKYGLRDVIVVSDADSASVMDRLGQEGANLLHELLQKKHTFGIGSGVAMRCLIKHIKHRQKNISVVQFSGAWTSFDAKEQPAADTGANLNLADEIVIQISQCIGATPYFMHVPAFVGSCETKKALMDEQYVRNNYEMIKRCEFAVVGIESSGTEAAPLEEQFLSEECREELLRLGAAGSICARYFDNRGKALQVSWDDKTMLPMLSQLRKIPLIIGIGAGKMYREAILGALRGKWIDVLITDTQTAESLLR